jgi:hypothetical protein
MEETLLIVELVGGVVMLLIGVGYTIRLIFTMAGVESKEHYKEETFIEDHRHYTD